MNIESELFKKYTLNEKALVEYGFKKENISYILEQRFLDNSFKIVIKVQNQKLTFKIFDLSFDEEYTNYKDKNQQGEFVNKVREEITSILTNIRASCYTPKYFIQDQSNRIAELIYQEFQDKPDFPWKKYENYGVFRNPSNDKWYALIMDINENKLNKKDKEVDIINLKIDEDKIEGLIKRKGFYKGYHMNKKNWITIVLDDAVSDEEIMNFIRISHAFTEKKKR